MSEQPSDALNGCNHSRWYTDQQRGERVCLSCGFTRQLVQRPRAKSPDGHSKIVSPGMVAKNLGSDDNKIIAQLRRETREGQEYLRQMIGLKRLPEEDDGAFWISFTQALKDKGLPEERIALVSNEFRALAKKAAAERLREMAWLAWGIDVP